MILVDLHMHSNFSDGMSAPEDLVKLAKRAGVSVISLTDHDTIEGVPRFLKAASRSGIRAISGVELSAEFPSTMHILGYNFDPSNEVFLSELSRLRDHRESRNEKILERLNDMGFSITMDEVLAESSRGVVARPHFARVMVKKGYAFNIRDCFDRFLKKGKGGYVSRVRLSPEKSISLINSAGGVAVLAHPVQTTSDLEELKVILSDLKGMGLWGLECISRHHSPEQIYNYMKLAHETDLYCTAGSDFHGTNLTSSRGLGIAVNEDFLPWARLGLSL